MTAAPAWSPVDATEAHDAVTRAEQAVLAERCRPGSPEQLSRLAGALEQRAAAWRLLAQAPGVDDWRGHAGRAMRLAADADEQRAKALRRRLTAGALR